MTLTILFLVPLFASLALNLYGRARFAWAVSELEASLGRPLVFDLSQLRTSPPPKQRNALTLLAEGAAELGPWSLEESHSIRQAVKLPRQEWGPSLEAEMRSAIQRHHKALGILHRAAPLTLSDYGISYPELRPSDILTPSPLALLRTGRLLNIEARLAFGDADTEGGLLAMQTLSRLTSSLAKEPLMILSLCAWDSEKHLLVAAREVLESTEPRAESTVSVDQIEALLPRIDHLADIRDSLVFETLWLFHRARGKPGEDDLLRGFGWAARYQLRPLIAAESFEAVGQVVQLIPVPFAEARKRLVSDHHTKGWALPETGPRLLDILVSEVPINTEASIDSPELVRKYLSALRGDPSVVKFRYDVDLLDAVLKTQRVASQRQLVDAAIAMRRIGIERGSYPLERPDLPVLDRPDPFAGRPIVYRLREDGSLFLQIENGRELSQQIFEGFDISGEIHRFDVILPPPR